MKGRGRLKSDAPRAQSREEALAEIVQSFHRLFRSIDTFSKYTLRAFGVSGPQIWALRTIERTGRIMVGDLSDRMHLHISTVSGILDRLEKGKFVVRRRSDRDRRIIHLEVTDRGRAILRRAPEPPRAKFARKLAGLGAGEIAGLLRGLRLMAELVELDEIETILAREERRKRPAKRSAGPRSSGG